MKTNAMIRQIILYFFIILSGSVIKNDLLAQNNNARIKIDIERQIGDIDKMIYGNFTEHLGRCIYGGIYDPGSPFANKDGFRVDVIEATKKLNVSNVRWPGGNFVSSYHWEDGIGPKNKRPVRINLSWVKKEDNSFGTDEFINWCKEVKTEPYICVNMGTGTMEEACNWVEYCNVDSGTYYSDLRIKNGFRSPHNVKYWALGNEKDCDWHIGYKYPDDYGKFALETAKMMKAIDKNIKLVAGGSANYRGDWIDWNRTVLKYLGKYVDYIALHNYSRNKNDDYYEFMASTDFAEKVIRVTEGIIKEELIKLNRKNPIYIAFDEYNVWSRTTVNEDLEEIYNLEDALVISSYLNVFIRNAHIVKIANLAQLVNVLAPICTSEKGIWYQTIFYPLELFANNCFGKSIETFVDCPTYKLNGSQVPYLDVSGVYNKAKNEIIVNVVNRHKDKPIITDIISQHGSFKGNAIIKEVNGDNIKETNSPDKQLIDIETKQKSVSGDKLSYSFPPHSFTMITIPLD